MSSRTGGSGGYRKTQEENEYIFKKSEVKDL